MPTLWISEYEHVRHEQWGQALPAAKEPPVAEQTVTYSTSTPSLAFNTKTRFIRLQSNAKAHLAFGSAPVATALMKYLSADIAEYFGVEPGDKVAAYDGSS